MQPRELTNLVSSTADAAFAIDGNGVVTAWNAAAAALFGRSEEAALGKHCSEILQGSDECGRVCSAGCSVRRAVQEAIPVGNFDLQVETANGRRWCNISVLVAQIATSQGTHSIHVVRPIDSRKKLEMLVRDFLVTETDMPAEQAAALVKTTRSAARQAELTRREIDVLRLLATGTKTSVIAERLHISRTTVNNHVQHILKKLGAHSRLEAIRRAEHAGLLRPGG